MARGRRKRIDIPQAAPLDGPTTIQAENGKYTREDIIHADTAQRATVHVNRASNIVNKWFDEGWPGFEHGTRLAIDWCHKRWEARGIIGSLTASMEPRISGGEISQYARDIEMRDELDEVRALFHPAYWEVFEGVVRWGRPAGAAGTELANNTPQAIAAARATVGLVANFIAAKRGY
jgi:hypothetical protein